MNILRIVLVVVAVILTYLFVLLVPFAFLSIPGDSIIASLAAWAVAAAAGTLLWRKLGEAPSAPGSIVFGGGLIVGGIGFAAGFFGPMIFAPDANQGPLLGIFITGPAGFVLGLIGGWVYWLIKER